MSLILLESFDDGAYAARPATTSGTNTGTGRTGSNARGYNATGETDLWGFAGHVTVVVGLAFYTAANDETYQFVRIGGDAGVTRHITLHRTVGGALTVSRGISTNLGSTDAGVISLSTWYYIELFVT